MTTATIIIIILTGLAAGILGGMVGIGGGIIIVPASGLFSCFFTTPGAGHFTGFDAFSRWYPGRDQLL